MQEEAQDLSHKCGTYAFDFNVSLNTRDFIILANQTFPYCRKLSPGINMEKISKTGGSSVGSAPQKLYRSNADMVSLNKRRYLLLYTLKGI